MKGGRKNHKTLNRKNKTKNKQKGGATLKDIGKFFRRATAGTAATTATGVGAGAATGAISGAVGSGTAGAGALAGLGIGATVGAAAGAVAAGAAGIIAMAKANREADKKQFHSRFYEEYMNEIQKEIDHQDFNIHEYSKLIPSLEKKLNPWSDTHIKDNILKAYNSDIVKKTMVPIVITKMRPDNYIIRTTNSLMPLLDNIEGESKIVRKKFHLYYNFRNKENLDNLYELSLDEKDEKIMPCSFMNPIHMRFNDYNIVKKNKEMKMNVEEEIKRQIEGGDPNIVKSNTFNQSDYFVPEKYSPRGPWNELSLKNGKESIGDNLTFFKGRQKYSDWRKPESFYIGVNERDDWIFWAKIASIIDYKPPLHSNNLNENWWLNTENGKINRVELSWNDLLQQLPITPSQEFDSETKSFKDWDSDTKTWFEQERNNMGNRGDKIDSMLDFYTNYANYIIPDDDKIIDNTNPEQDPKQDPKLETYKKELSYHNHLTDAAWKLFKNRGDGVASKAEIERLGEDNTAKKNFFRRTLNEVPICKIPGLFNGNREEYTNILINKWFPYKNEITSDSEFYTPKLDEMINDIIDEESNENKTYTGEQKIKYMKEIHLMIIKPPEYKLTERHNVNIEIFQQKYKEYVKYLAQKIDRFIEEDNRLLTSNYRQSGIPDQIDIPDQKLCIRHYISTNFPSQQSGKTEVGEDYFNIINPSIKAELELDRTRLDACNPIDPNTGGLEEKEQTKTRIQIIKNLTDVVFQFYVNMERIMPRIENSENKSVHVKDTSTNYLSVRLLNGIYGDNLPTPLRSTMKRGSDTIGDVTKPMMFGGTAEFHFIPTYNVLYASRIKKDGTEKADIQKLEEDARNKPYNPFLPSRTGDVNIRNANVRNNYLYHSIKPTKTVDDGVDYMTFGQLLDLYIFKLKKEFMSINEGEETINKLRNENLQHINPKLFWDLAYANKIVDNYNKSFEYEEGIVHPRAINEINKKNKEIRIKIQERNIKTMDKTQELFNLIEARCPHCKYNSVDYTASTHQPEYKVDMLPHDNHQNGAWYFYCNNDGCNAFLGAMWREKSAKEMGPWSTIGLETRTDMPRNTLSAISLLSSVSDKDQKIHKANLTDVYLENEYIKELYYQDIYSDKLNLIELVEKINIQRAKPEDEQLYKKGLEYLKILKLDPNKRTRLNILTRENYEKIIEIDTNKTTNESNKKEIIFTKDEQRLLFQKIYKLTSSKNVEEKVKNIEQISETLVNIYEHPAFEENMDVHNIISEFVYKSIYNIVSYNYNEDIDLTTNEIKESRFTRIINKIYDDITKLPSTSLVQREKLTDNKINSYYKDYEGLRIETKLIKNKIENESNPRSLSESIGKANTLGRLMEENEETPYIQESKVGQSRNPIKQRVNPSISTPVRNTGIPIAQPVITAPAELVGTQNPDLNTPLTPSAPPAWRVNMSPGESPLRRLTGRRSPRQLDNRSISPSGRLAAEPGGQEKPIFISMLNGRTLTIPVSFGAGGEGPSNTSIEVLKEKIKDATNGAVVPRRLIFAGKELENGRTLADYNIQKESTLFLLE